MSWLSAFPYIAIQSVMNTGATTPFALTLTASATPNTKGSWVQLTASATLDTYMIVFTLGQVAQSTVDTGMLMDIGVGGSGSEVVVVPNLMVGFNFNPAFFSVPVNIPAGSRIALRVQCATGSVTAPIGAHLFQAHRAGPPPFAGPVTPYGINTSTSHGIGMSGSGTAHVKGAWAQVTSATSTAHKGLFVLVQAPSGTIGNRLSLMDIGIGGAGSEVVVIPDLYVETASTERVFGPYPPMVFLDVGIPSGTRIAARAQTDSTAAPVHEVAVYGMG